MRAVVFVLAALVAACRSEAPRRADAPMSAAATDSAEAPFPSSSAPPNAKEVVVPAIDRAVDEAIARGDVPGAVVLVIARDRVIHRRAYGLRRVAPQREAMTVDTLFDLASLTKPLATALSIHLLAAEWKLALRDRAKRHLPELGDDQRAITIEHLLLHTSGLPAVSPLGTFADGPSAAVRSIGALRLASPPGASYKYSDLGYVLLGAIVERVSGERLDVFARRRIFEPLGLRDTTFLPSGALRARAAPTNRDGTLLEGSVHDPRASLLGGVAGHAGLFSTADDLGALARMLLHGGAPVLPPGVVAAMTAAVKLPNAQRTLGWDVHRALSSGVGYGHSGFTGTLLSIDPSTESAVVILTSRLHPNEKGDVTRLRKEVLEAARAAIAEPVVRTGIDVLAREGFARLAGKKVALVTNASAVDRNGVRTVDVLRAASMNVVALLSPEHGFGAKAEGFVGASVDAKTGLPVKSLYGASRKKPIAEDLEGADTLVFDLQDAGVRFYTYETTLGLVLESAKELGLRVVVLDRPNPVSGAIEGPLLDEGKTSFTAYHRVPIRHGLTVGELARLFNEERGLQAPLDVVKMEGWKRDMLFADTGLPWVAPSPNLRSDVEALLYPGVALVEGTNVSVGRGTETPFEIVGAPFVDGERLAAHLEARKLPGVAFRAVRFTPTSSTHAGVSCGGVRIVVTDARKLAPVRLGVALASSLASLHPSEWQSKNLLAIVGNEATVRAIERGDPLEAIVASWHVDERAFEARRRSFLLY